ncbi:MAG: amidohydrolase family protein, partial [Acetobacteraceae bacterium]|nr:amidohydrolase family protein [Acetobacteraceae bacterium]
MSIMRLTRRDILCSGFAALAASGPAWAQDEAVALDGAAVFDGERRLDPATILIVGGTIRAIGPAGSVEVPSGARRLDLAGSTVIPGLISAHAHVGNSAGAETGGRFFTRENVLAQLRRYLAFGVTTLAALGLGPAEPFFAIRDEVRGGCATGVADLLGAGPGIGAVRGLPPAGAPMNLLDDQVVRPETPEAAREAVREMARRRVDVVKLWVDDAGGTMPMMPPAIFSAAIEEAHRHGLRAAAHIHSLEQARAVVLAGVDIVAHGVRDRPVDEALVRAMRERGTWYIATIALDEANYLYADRPALLEDPFLRAALDP